MAATSEPTATADAPLPDAAAPVLEVRGLTVRFSTAGSSPARWTARTTRGWISSLVRSVWSLKTSVICLSIV